MRHVITQGTQATRNFTLRLSETNEIAAVAENNTAMLLMPLRHTPVLPLRRGLSRPSRSDIGASSAARAAAGGSGMLLAGGRGSAALQIAFCQLPRFLLISTGARRCPSRLTGGSCRP